MSATGPAPCQGGAYQEAPPCHQPMPQTSQHDTGYAVAAAVAWFHYLQRGQLWRGGGGSSRGHHQASPGLWKKFAGGNEGRDRGLVKLENPGIGHTAQDFVTGGGDIAETFCGEQLHQLDARHKNVQQRGTNQLALTGHGMCHYGTEPLHRRSPGPPPGFLKLSTML